MRRTLYELVTGYAAATGCTCNIEEGSCHAVLSIEGMLIHIGLVESSGMLVAQTGVGLLPGPGTPGREEFCMSLLEANNLFGETSGFTLGVNTGVELVTLQLSWDILHLDAESFAHIVHNLISVAADWIARLDTWRPSEPVDNGASTLSGEDFARYTIKV